jgi:ubiquinone/menaquinone biosynthesis C-methylase UbiE
MAWSYDYVSWLVSMGLWREWQLAALSYLKGQKVLEIAHGPGHMLVELERNGFSVHGIDLSTRMGLIARRRVLKHGVTVNIIRGDARELPYAEDSFDSILSTFPTDFMMQLTTIQSLSSVLKPGGRIVIVPQARLEGGGIIRRVIEWLYVVTGQRVDAVDDRSREFLRLQLDKLSKTFGFEVDIKQVELESSTVTVLLLVMPTTIES